LRNKVTDANFVRSEMHTCNVTFITVSLFDYFFCGEKIRQYFWMLENLFCICNILTLLLTLLY